jgi:hypothetical protein
VQRSEKKTVLIARLVSLLENDIEAKDRFFEVFRDEMAVEPWELETLLGCTPAERKRWVKDGKLIPLATRSVWKSGKELVYPIFDRRYVTSITPELLTVFREEHASLVALRRKTGAEKAKKSKAQRTSARLKAFREAEELFIEWARLDFPELAAVFRLAYWTQWASRWAKENVVKAMQATKHGSLYLQRKEVWYRRKDEAIAVLAGSSYAHLSYYRPEDADKIELVLCDDHYTEMREGYYEGKWDFYTSSKREINECAACRVSVLPEYYSLYALEISATVCADTSFSFHVPYPIGKAFLPSPRVLPLVVQVEQEEGLFRFGRRLDEEEKVLFREKDVEEQLVKALDEAKRTMAHR